jgi:hypothetical protein
MTISLPYLLVAGVFAAPVGVLLLLAQVMRPHKPSLLAGIFGALASCLFLGYILWSIQQDFMGWYKPLAWSTAFFAGYAALAVVPYCWHLVELLRSRRTHAAAS